jgi:hypothetical protein
MKRLLYVAVALIAIYALGNSRAVAKDTSSQATASSAGGADAFVDEQFAFGSSPEICTDLAKGIAGKEGGDLLSVGPPHQHDDRPAADFAIAPGAEPGLSANRINLCQLAER